MVKAQHRGEFPGFSFCLKCPGLGAGKANKSKMPLNADQKSPTELCSLYPKNFERIRLARQKTFRTKTTLLQQTPQKGLLPGLTPTSKGCLGSLNFHPCHPMTRCSTLLPWWCQRRLSRDPSSRAEQGFVELSPPAHLCASSTPGPCCQGCGEKLQRAQGEQGEWCGWRRRSWCWKAGVKHPHETAEEIPWPTTRRDCQARVQRSNQEHYTIKKQAS